MARNIAINGRCFKRRRISGVERYAREITQRLGRDFRSIAPHRPLGKVSGHLWEQLVLPTKLNNNEALWSPANAGPWIIHRQAVTIHDASVFDHPEWFHSSYATWTRLSWKILARRVQTIITVSNFSRERLIHHLHIPEHRIHVILNGVGKPFEPQTKSSIENVCAKYLLNKPFFLFVGTLEPRKNLTKMFEAFEILDQPTLILAIVREKGKVFTDAINKVNNRPCVQFLGHIQDADLPALYSGACATIIPSVYEGFGLTALEAMACGSPVIASNTASLPEVVGEAALLVNPFNVTEIKNAMQKIIDDRSLRFTLCERSLQKAGQFTWDESARKTQSLLESL